MPRKISKSDREVQLSALALADGYEFAGWVGEYIGNRTYVKFRCEVHGDWSVKLSSFATAGNRCVGCYAARKRVPRDECETKLHALALADGLTFVGWVTEYKDVQSRAIMHCAAHGNWSVSVNNFANGGSRCPACASYGYSSGVPGTLYALLSECGSMVKIGISKNMARRHRELSRYTPFKFTILRELPNTDGSIPPTLEKLFHDQFPSAGLTGFDGATEWRQMSPDVTTWLDLLQ